MHCRCSSIPGATPRPAGCSSSTTTRSSSTPSPARSRAGAIGVPPGRSPRETFVSFLYVLHYSLHMPEFWGIDHWGMWLLGAVAIIWTVDCFVGFYLTLPVARGADPSRPAAVSRQLARGWWARWAPAWRIKTTGSPYRINFDIHRVFGLWTWALLFILAFTAFSLNLYREVFYPVMSLVSEVTPTPFDVREPADKHRPIDPEVGYAEVIERARAEAQRRGLAGAGGVRVLQPGIRHLRRRVLRGRRRSWCRRRRAAATSTMTGATAGSGRAGALGRHRRRHLRPGAVPAAQRPDPRACPAAS